MRHSFTSTLVCLLLAVAAAQAYSWEYNVVSQQRLEVAMRMIGHEVLLRTGDSTSRVLPIQVEDGRYRISFEKPFAFVGDDLVETIDRVLEKTEMVHGYILSVESCEHGEVVYAFQAGDRNHPDMVPCRARETPMGCYHLIVTPLDLEASLSIQDGSLDAGVQKDAQRKSPLVPLAAASLFVIGSVLVWRWKRPTSDYPSVGAYRLDTKNRWLMLDGKKTELTEKELNLLLLLKTTPGVPVERNVLLEKVWGGNADYIGRTVDVFVSKLRKKLEGDPKLQIVNVRGVGYKLVSDK